MQKQSRNKKTKRTKQELARERRLGLIVLLVLIMIIIWLISLLVSTLKDNPEYNFPYGEEIEKSGTCWVDEIGQCKCVLDSEIVKVSYYYIED